MAIAIAEFCGVVAGTFALTHSAKIRWLEAAVVVLLASLASYFLGVALWTWSYNSGILFHEGLRTLSVIAFFLPELIGTVIGSIIIHTLARVEWRASIIAMATAMVVSFTVGFISLFYPP